MRPPSPWAVFCFEHGLVYLTHDEYVQHLMAADNTWICPICQRWARWSDENYEKWQEESEEGEC